MAIKKSEAVKLSPEEFKDISRCERHIDEKIRRVYRPGEEVYVDFRELGNPSRREVDAIVARYQEAGWNVKVEHDQREGSYFRFS